MHLKLSKADLTIVSGSHNSLNSSPCLAGLVVLSQEPVLFLLLFCYTAGTCLREVTFTFLPNSSLVSSATGEIKSLPKDQQNQNGLVPSWARGG